MNSYYSSESTTDDVMQGINLSGRVALITGASSGLGVETARALASGGARVLLAARDEKKTRSCIREIMRRAPHADLSFISLDLSNTSSVLQCAERLRRLEPRLDLLINNAGVMACPLRRTEEGWEWQLAVNHIGHFLLTSELVPLLLQAPAPRVVNLTSGGHQLGAPDPVDPHFSRRPYDKWLAYGQSKTANIWHAIGLFERLASRGLSAFAVHPGAVGTDLSRHMSDEEIKSLRKSSDDAPGLVFKSVSQGAATTVWAATSASLAGKGGLYLEDCGIGQPIHGGALSATGYAPWALDRDRAEVLWRQSEEWIGRRCIW